MMFNPPPMAPMVGGVVAAGVSDAVTKLKELQRSDAVGKAQWEAFTDQNGGGVRDPSKHDALFVQSFLTQYQSGVRLQVAPSTSLVDLVKEGQRKSTSWKSCWAAYCQIHGGGVNDPAKHDNAFLAKFLNFLGSSGERMLTMTSNPMMGMGIPGGNSKDQLVMAVKAFQRQGEDHKEKWGTFCDTHLGGIRDPSRHDAMTLQSFLTSNGVQVLTDVGRPTVSTGDAEKDLLVASVKAFQRKGETQKEQWGTYADTNLGGKRDPARHDISTLTAFLQACEI